MAYLTIAQKLAFVHELISILQEHSASIIVKGYDLTQRIAKLEANVIASEESRNDQVSAQSFAKTATKKANVDLNTAYILGSATVDLFTGILGKKDPIVVKLKKIRPKIK